MPPPDLPSGGAGGAARGYAAMTGAPRGRRQAPAQASTELARLKRRLAQAHRILAAGGLLPLTKGHVSARAPAGEGILILGHIHAMGRTLDTTTEDDITAITPDGVALPGALPPVGERYIHTAVLAGRTDVNAVVHCHPAHATAFGIAGVNVLPVGNRGGIFAPRVEILDFDGQIDTPERGELVRDALGDAPALVLRNHGIVAVGTKIETAVVTAFALEETARLQWIAASVGRPQPLSQIESARVAAGGPDHDEFFSHVWAYYVAMDPLRAGD
jgi:L-fuculose-phosphate aldolase